MQHTSLTATCQLPLDLDFVVIRKELGSSRPFFVRFLSPFDLNILLSNIHFPISLQTFYIRASPRSAHHRCLRTHRRARYYHSVKFSGSRTPLLSAHRLRRRAACRWRHHLEVCIFTFSPSSSILHVDDLSRTISALHINTLRFALSKARQL